MAEKFKNHSKVKNRYVSMVSLVVFSVVPFTYNSQEASAAAVAGRTASRTFSSVNRFNSFNSGSSLNGSASGLRNRSIGSYNGSYRPSYTLPNTYEGRDVSLSRGGYRPNTDKLTSLENQVHSMQVQAIADGKKASSTFNKAVLVSGVVSSAAMVAGVVGGVIQQSNFISLTNQQNADEAAMQKEIQELTAHYTDVEIKEAEDYIAKFYMDNYGIDLRAQQ